MCLSPITIPNQTKFISTKHADPFLMQIPCGHCAECASTLGNQWYYRAYYEWQELTDNGAYVLFDTLTYDDKHLPHLSNCWHWLSKSEDFPCFNYYDVRLFLQGLRTRLIRCGYRKDSFRYFLSSEYGSSEYYNYRGIVRRAQHRPHYHILLYVYDKRIDPIWLSKTIGEVWNRGRTDGVPFQSKEYVLGKNVISADCPLEQSLRVCRYVTKYVQKSCQFDKEISWRINKVMHRMAEEADPISPSSWLETETAHKERLKLTRWVNQFHRQSQHFGETALRDLDLNQLYETGCLFMPDPNGVKIPIPLPTYYARKLFYEQVNVNGARYWQLNDEGIQYRKARHPLTLQRLIDRYQCIKDDYHLDIDAEKLANYTFQQRGRINAKLPETTLLERLDVVDIFNYSTSSDKMQFGCRGLSHSWLGDKQTGYRTTKIHKRIPLQTFIQQKVYFEPKLEKDLELIFNKMKDKNEGKQKAYEEKQRLANLFKHFFD